MIDVIMITKNSMTGSPIFRRCLGSIFDNVPVKNLIVVDDSEDNTEKILAEYPNVKLVKKKGNRAMARNVGMKLVTTDKFMFVDDDVILCNDWYEKAINYFDEDVGMLWGYDVICNPHSRNRMKIMYYLRHKSEYELMARNFYYRGGLHDTLIRTEAVEKINIPRDLHVYEDWYIKEYVEKKGYKIIAPEDLYCHHYLNPKYTPSVIREIGRLQRKYRLQSKTVTFRNLGLALPKSLAILLTSGDLQAASDQLKMYVYNFVGSISS